MFRTIQLIGCLPFVSLFCSIVVSNGRRQDSHPVNFIGAIHSRLFLVNRTNLEERKGRHP
jgi:hypothetical protein